ncbi:hypothetical protein SCYAM73S_03932 [Streptomyces cyaneofuscatus]
MVHTCEATSPPRAPTSSRSPRSWPASHRAVLGAVSRTPWEEFERDYAEVRIKLQGPSKTTVLRLDRHRVKPDPALFGDLKVLLGPSCLAG